MVEKERSKKMRGALFGVRILFVFRGKAGLAPGEETGFIHGVEMSGGFGRKLVVEVSSGREGVEAAVKHALRIVVCHCTDLDTKVGQHGVRTPAAEYTGGVRVHARTEERCGTAWAQALHGEEERIHPCRGVDVTCTVLESIGDMVVLYGAP